MKFLAKVLLEISPIQNYLNYIFKNFQCFFLISKLFSVFNVYAPKDPYYNKSKRRFD